MNCALISVDVLLFVSEVVTEKKDPEIATVESDNRYNRSFTRSEIPHAMYTFLENQIGSSLIRSFVDVHFRNCVITTSSPAKFLSPQNTKRVLLYLKKIITKIKDRGPAVRTLQHELRSAFQQINANNQLIGDHFKFFVLVLFLRLFTILRSCKKTLSLNSAVNNQNQMVAPADDSDVLFYIERIIHIYSEAFDYSKCRKRAKRSLWDNRNYASNDYSFDSKIPLRVEERLPYADSAYRDQLINSFLANSLPDLDVPSSVIKLDKKKTYFSSSTPLLINDNVDISQIPEPEPTLIITSTDSPSSDDNRWSMLSSTNLHRVPLLPNKPSISQTPSSHFTTESLIKWKPINFVPLQSSLQHGHWNTAGSHYHKPPSSDPNSRPTSTIQVVDDM